MTTPRERLGRPPFVVLDGATGTELARRGVDTTLPLWSARALFETRGLEMLDRVHADYVAAGAEMLTTNTFRTTARALSPAGLEGRRLLLNRRAVESARRAARSAGAGRTVFVAGGMAPLEDCYRVDRVPPQPDCVREHLRQADLLAGLGVDLLLIETMNCRREAFAAVLAARTVGLDAILSLCPGAPDRLLSGEPLADLLPRLVEAGGGRILALLLNCGAPELLARAAPHLAAHAAGLPWGMYAHLGRPDDRVGWRLPREHAPQAYADWGAARRREGATILGGCCGTTPEHIRRLVGADAA